MNEKEWLDYFETINNRKPTEEEIQQAKANGEFISQEAKDEGINPQQAQLSDQVTQAVSQVAPAKTGLSKKAKIIIASVVGAIVLVALSFGGTCKAVKYLKEPICLKLIAFTIKIRRKWLMVWNLSRKVV